VKTEAVSHQESGEKYLLFTLAGYHFAMKYMMIVMVLFAMSFASLGSALFAKGELPAMHPVETVAENTDASESSDSEEPTPSDDPKHYSVRPLCTNDFASSSYQRNSFRYCNGKNLAPLKPPSLNIFA